jgi:predicted amidohydrolase
VDFTRKVRAAAVQISPVLFSREGTTEKVLEAIESAAKAGAELVVFPRNIHSLLSLLFVRAAPSIDG